MRSVTETPTEPRHYAAVSVAYGALLAGVALSGARRGGEHAVSVDEMVPLGAATFALAKTISREKVETWLREPFLEEAGVEEREPKGHGLRYVTGELLSCTRCLGAWSALGLVGLRTASPAAGRAVTSVLAASAMNDFLQTGFIWLCSRANLARAQEAES
jgi:hypothetical protein